MNKTYRRNFRGLFYRLNRSVKARDVKKLFGRDVIEMPINFFPYGKNPNSKLWNFNYSENYVDIKIHLRKLAHGKFKTIKRGEITDDYRFSCRRDCGC